MVSKGLPWGLLTWRPEVLEAGPFLPGLGTVLAQSIRLQEGKLPIMYQAKLLSNGTDCTAALQARWW